MTIRPSTPEATKEIDYKKEFALVMKDIEQKKAIVLLQRLLRGRAV